MELLDDTVSHRPARRYLLMRSDHDVNILWLDEPGSCEHETVFGDQYRTRWHLKRCDDGKNYVLLCPNGLDYGEWAHVFVDSPPGSWQRQMLDYKNAPSGEKGGWERV